MPAGDATAVTPKRGGDNVVAMWMLQIQHSFRNASLTRVYGALTRERHGLHMHIEVSRQRGGRGLARRMARG